MHKHLVILALSAWALLAPLGGLADQSSIQWRQITEDLENATTSYGSDRLTTSVISLFRTSLKRFHIQVLQASNFGKSKMSAKQMCEAAHAALCVNANFFDPAGKPLGLVVSRGIVSNPMHRGGNVLTGIFAVTKDGIKINGRDDFDLGGTAEAVQAGPRLISKGRNVTGLRDSATVRRSGICIDRESRLVIYVIADSWSHSTTDEILTLLKSSEIGCVDALNLDGGGSSQLFLGGLDGVQDVWLPGRDDVPIALALSSN